MRRRTYLAGTTLGTVTSAAALLAGCLDSSSAGGSDSEAEDGTETNDSSDDDAGDDGAKDDEVSGDESDDDTDSTNDDDRSGEEGEEQAEAESGEQDDAENEESDGDEREEQDESDERVEDDESPSEAVEAVAFEVIDMTPSVESGTEFTYIVLAHTDGAESIPGDAALIGETDAVIDSTSYEATPSGGEGFELTYEAPTVTEETEVGLTVETDHGTVNLGQLRVYPSDAPESDNGSGQETATDDGDIDE